MLELFGSELMSLWLNVAGVPDLGLDAIALTSLQEMPDLEADDLRASLLYASRKLNHPVLVT